MSFKNIGKLVLFVVTSFNLNAQVKLSAKGGSFEDLVPWNGGYLGIVQTQAYAVMPKFRQFQFFNGSTGEMTWSTKVTPFNFNNESLCHHDSPYAYYINMPFGKTAMVEKKSNNDLLNIYQIDQKGSLVEKQISLSGELEPMKVHAKQLMSTYLGAYKDGIVFVSTHNNQDHHIVFIDHAFNVKYKKLTIEWNEEDWKARKVSKLKYVLTEDKFYMIQLKLDEAELKGATTSIDLASLEMKDDIKFALSFEGYSLNSKSGSNINYSIDEQVITDYEYEVDKGDITYHIPTLGSFANFEYTNQGLKMYSYFKNMVPGSKKDVEKEGFLAYNLDGGQTVKGPIKAFEFVDDGKGSKWHSFHVTNSGEFIFITCQKKNKSMVESSQGGVQEFDENFTMAEILLSYMSGTTRSKSDAVDVICVVGDKYFGIAYEGMSNSLGNSKGASIYAY